MKSVPVSSYRVQLNPRFGFKDLSRIVPYLSRLGISWLYVSPIFKARRGSMHGYDVVDPTEVNPELGTPEDLDHLFETVKASGMGWLQDIVPNHMAFDAQNRILMDVLESGPNSRYFQFFDVEWDHPFEEIKGRILAPFLGDFYGESLEAGHIHLLFDVDGFAVSYYDHRFPIKIDSYADLLTHRLDKLKKKISPSDPDLIKFHGILGVIYTLRTFHHGETLDERYNQIRFIKMMLWELYNNNKHIGKYIDYIVRISDVGTGKPSSIEWMDRLLFQQYFRLSYWKVAVEEINYRRFFDINDLISIRVEERSVFDFLHALIFKWLREKKITGVRIDHIDGLYDPAQYLERLRESIPDTYTVAEKILHPAEPLPAHWPVDGTTGYDFLNVVNGLFCDAERARAMTSLYARFGGTDQPFQRLVYEKKRFIALRRMAGDIENLARVIRKLAGRYRRGSDLTLLGLKRAILEFLSHFPVYRTYFGEGLARKEDPLYVDQALQAARAEYPELSHELAFIENLHNREFLTALPPADRSEWLRAVMRFQQFTGPLMAKGCEDTALYVYHRLLSLNEVGGDPDRFGISVASFHDFMRSRLRTQPDTLNATSTHDTKRGEDVRARINVLSEIPREWEGKLRRWTLINRKLKPIVNGKAVPDVNDEYALYQTMLGAWPHESAEREAFVERLKHYAVKALREAKVHSNWLSPNTEYEAALCTFIDRILSPEQNSLFLEAFLPFQKRIAAYGTWNSLAQTLLKTTAPGIPDFYQGTELWDLSLVDPDNRRPVDYSIREAYLTDIERREATDMLGLIEELLTTRETGRLKLFLIYRALKIRNRHAALFERGEYLPIEVKGRHRRHVVAFVRRHEGACALVAVPRLLVDLVGENDCPLGAKIWGSTSLSVGFARQKQWTNALTGQAVTGGSRILAASLFDRLPVALLLGEGPRRTSSEEARAGAACPGHTKKPKKPRDDASDAPRTAGGLAIRSGGQRSLRGARLNGQG